jgi:hypothetical protein
MANDDDDYGECLPMPPLPLVVNGEEHQWEESFSSLSSFGSLEQEGGEDEDEYTFENDDDVDDDDDRGMTTMHGRRLF